MPASHFRSLHRATIKPQLADARLEQCSLDEAVLHIQSLGCHLVPSGRQVQHTCTLLAHLQVGYFRLMYIGVYPCKGSSNVLSRTALLSVRSDNIHQLLMHAPYMYKYQKKAEGL